VRAQGCGFDQTAAVTNHTLLGIAQDMAGYAIHDAETGAVVGFVTGCLLGEFTFGTSCIVGLGVGAVGGAFISPADAIIDLLNSQMRWQKDKQALDNAQASSHVVLGCTQPNCILQPTKALSLDRSSTWNSSWDR
jgi:hypothetical protein